jgi:chromosome segregation ATPase
MQQATSTIESNAKHLDIAQNAAKEALRRIEDTERSRDDLQAEGTTLMKSLEEMRPKFVELTGAKLELGEKVGSLERAITSRDDIIVQLESSLDELRDRLEQAEKDWQAKLSRSERTHALAQQSTSETQKAHAQLQDELASSLASIRTLEADRSTYHQEAARRMEEIERLTSTSLAQAEELTILRQEVDERRTDQVGCLLSYSHYLLTDNERRKRSRTSLHRRRMKLKLFASISSTKRKRSSASTSW